MRARRRALQGRTAADVVGQRLLGRRTTIERVADRTRRARRPAAGKQWLDVAAGTGDVAIPAALGGAHVTGLDLAPELLERARRRGEEAGVEVRWIRGRCRAAALEDGSFDVVTSCFGMMSPRARSWRRPSSSRWRAPARRSPSRPGRPGLNGKMFRRSALSAAEPGINPRPRGETRRASASCSPPAAREPAFDVRTNPVARGLAGGVGAVHRALAGADGPRQGRAGAGGPLG